MTTVAVYQCPLCDYRVDTEAGDQAEGFSPGFDWDAEVPEDWFCPDGKCEPVIGGVITYFDTAHITATYAKTLATQFDARLHQTGMATFD